MRVDDVIDVCLCDVSKVAGAVAATVGAEHDVQCQQSRRSAVTVSDVEAAERQMSTSLNSRDWRRVLVFPVFRCSSRGQREGLC